MTPITFTRPQRGRILAAARKQANCATLRDLAQLIGARMWEVHRFLDPERNEVHPGVLLGVMRAAGWTWADLQQAAGRQGERTGLTVGMLQRARKALNRGSAAMPDVVAPCPHCGVWNPGEHADEAPCVACGKPFVAIDLEDASA